MLPVDPEYEQTLVGASEIARWFFWSNSGSAYKENIKSVQVAPWRRDIHTFGSIYSNFSFVLFECDGSISNLAFVDFRITQFARIHAAFHAVVTVFRCASDDRRILYFYIISNNRSKFACMTQLSTIVLFL